jgi:ABC-type lipoprotein release transport system permease subunit
LGWPRLLPSNVSKKSVSEKYWGSVAGLWQMLSKDFALLVLIACFISPISYYLLNDWLQHYEYRTELSWWVFVAAGLGAIAIALLTVSYQAIRAALMNPIKSLKTE